MNLERIRFKKLDRFLRKHLGVETPKTSELIKKLSAVKKRGYLTKNELIEICDWKAARARKYIKQNRKDKLKDISAKAFKAKDEKEKMEILTKLHGVGIPMGSAILMLTDPKNYGVIDRRAWGVLYKLRVVKTKPRGVNFSYEEWLVYLDIIRYFARKYRVTARDVERTLYINSKEFM